MGGTITYAISLKPRKSREVYLSTSKKAHIFSIYSAPDRDGNVASCLNFLPWHFFSDKINLFSPKLLFVRYFITATEMKLEQMSVKLGLRNAWWWVWPNFSSTLNVVSVVGQPTYKDLLRPLSSGRQRGIWQWSEKRSDMMSQVCAALPRVGYHW